MELHIQKPDGRGLSLLPTTYKILSIILLSSLIPYAEEVIGDHQCGFWRNRSTADHIFYICQIVEKKWEYNEAVHQLFIDFKKAYDSVRREVLYNILIEFGISKKLVSLIKMCLTETYSRVRVGKNLSGMFPWRETLKHLLVPSFRMSGHTPLLPVWCHVVYKESCGEYVHFIFLFLDMLLLVSQAPLLPHLNWYPQVSGG